MARDDGVDADTVLPPIAVRSSSLRYSCCAPRGVTSTGVAPAVCSCCGSRSPSRCAAVIESRDRQYERSPTVPCLPWPAALFISSRSRTDLGAVAQYGTAGRQDHELPAARRRHQLLRSRRPVRVLLLPRRRHPAAACWGPVKLLEGPRRVFGAGSTRRGDRETHLASPDFRQHLRWRNHGRAHRALPAVHHVGAECDLKTLTRSPRSDPGVHLRVAGPSCNFSQSMELEDEHH